MCLANLQGGYRGIIYQILIAIYSDYFGEGIFLKIIKHGWGEEQMAQGREKSSIPTARSAVLLRYLLRGAGLF